MSEDKQNREGGRLRGWLLQIWPTRNRLVIADYAAIGQQHPLFLADLAWRASVFSKQPHPRSEWEAGRLEGRRELALEVINLAKADPHYLLSLLEQKPK